MTIETKYNAGDYVYLMNENRPRRGEIFHIKADFNPETLYGPLLIISYHISYPNGDSSFDVAERDLFPTQEELMKHVFEL